MAIHRRITFAKGSVGRFIKKHGLSMTYLEVPPEMICRVRSHEGEKFFILTFRKSNGQLMKVPYSQGALVREYPEIVGILGSLAGEMLTYYQNETAESFCSEFSIPEDECEKQWATLKTLAERNEEFFGAEAYDELIQMSMEGRFEMEGAKGWQRSLTCGL